MRIIIYGLGIIGGSLAVAFNRAGHEVFAKNRSRDAIEYALERDMIDGEVNSYEGADLVILALPPKVAMRELDEGRFPAGCIVSDVCGVKRALEETVCSKPRAYRYVGIHPMAGKETSGITSASVDLFDGANLVVTSSEQTDRDALSSVKELAKEIGFGRIVECSAERHDEMIALTSQLAHIASSSYVKSPLSEDCEGFTGGSFQDMTRVAGVDENMWTELFLLNRDKILKETERLVDRLAEYRDALRDGDEERIRSLMREGRLFREQYFPRK